MDTNLRFELACLIGMALSNLSLEQPLDPLREQLPELQRKLITQEELPIQKWLPEIEKKSGVLPHPLIPGGDAAASILYFAHARAPNNSLLKRYLAYVAHFINKVTYSPEP